MFQHATLQDLLRAKDIRNLSEPTNGNEFQELINTATVGRCEEKSVSTNHNVECDISIDSADQASKPSKKIEETHIAFSTHSACFICRARDRSLHRVKKDDILFAYKNYGIYIKHHARLCDDHRQNNGQLRKEEFEKIPTKFGKISDDNRFLLNIIASNNSCSMFQQFNNMANLDDTECLKLTGWTKDEFQRFASCITSINDNQHRSKEQLIALYRYWLRTGIDQQSLASMFNENIKQNRISDYLAQIRKAIYKEIVPSYLGVTHDRNFYLNWNTIMTNGLFDLNYDDLVVVADGTYCRIEKSANNVFQYDTYSGQKKDSLIKPFVLCCADGYIIDCYGPFAATCNDAQIMKYILENDADLRTLLVPDKTMLLLDRGE